MNDSSIVARILFLIARYVRCRVLRGNIDSGRGYGWRWCPECSTYVDADVHDAVTEKYSWRDWLIAPNDQPDH